MVFPEPEMDGAALIDDSGQASTAAEFTRQYGEHVDSVFPTSGGGLYSAALNDVEPANMSAWLTQATGIKQPI